MFIYYIVGSKKIQCLLNKTVVVRLMMKMIVSNRYMSFCEMKYCFHILFKYFDYLSVGDYD